MTSSVQPPVLDPSLGTPSNEWAEKTTSSFDPPSKGEGAPQNTTSGQATSHSPGVTPGSELPGAFPQGETSTGTTNITETIVDTARQYLPSGVVNTVETYLGKPLSPNNRERPLESHASSRRQQQLFRKLRTWQGCQGLRARRLSQTFAPFTRTSWSFA